MKLVAYLEKPEMDGLLNAGDGTLATDQNISGDRT